MEHKLEQCRYNLSLSAQFISKPKHIHSSLPFFLSFSTTENYPFNRQGSKMTHEEGNFVYLRVHQPITNVFVAPRLYLPESSLFRLAIFFVSSFHDLLLLLTLPITAAGVAAAS